MLSSALQTKSRLSQNSSVKRCSVSSPTRSWRASTLIRGFITFARAAAASDFGWPTLSSRKRNWRLRLETSMRSLSVTCRTPLSPKHRPMSAKFFMNSQPSAPQPTMKTCALPRRSWKVLPKTAIWSS